MRRRIHPARGVTCAVLVGLACGGCGASPGGGAGQPAGSVQLTLGAYTTPREIYGQSILSSFRAHWEEKTGRTIGFRESYLGSGAQSRAIVRGFEADVAALSLEPDIERLVEAGLITHDWKAGPHAGMVSRSIVVLGVREGNPLGIRDWDDLARPGVKVLTPSPRTSGGAMWNIAALYGAALRGGTSVPAGDSAAAEELLRRVLANVAVLDKGARESMLTFEAGVGDVIITYENEVIAAQRAGRAMDYVVPRATILIENPVAVVDVYAARHGVQDAAAAFVEYLRTPAAQRAFAEHGYRPVDETVAREFADRFPAVGDLFTIRDLGGWPLVTSTLFGEGGVFDRASAAATGVAP